ncbi:helix-turn-helix domain-containing protein [Lentilactobacillus sp. Marseille-Q4993]|uniref:winged helix-turn-helix transcriptional regulator n=1 Tax=Lentilactobacillus sp. Marseille-Q4993 TaxID=3039492 RepID=UPI0024BC22A0|nr:helix-turn-helix domain-containing protein [Lentilactobacillus sp. Marseille-Q4993]
MSDDIRESVANKLAKGEYDCAKEFTMSMFSGKHKLFILWNLKNGEEVHFNEFGRLIPSASKKVLSNQLQELQEDGLINKDFYDEGKVKRTVYRMSKLGYSLVPILEMMYSWGENRIGDLDLNTKYG